MNPTPPVPSCPQCGKPLPAATPLGLCPECLLRAGLPTMPASDPTGAPSASARFQAPSPAELAPHFPQLEIVELIGKGGMGAVYKARQPALDRLVALKILRPRDDADPAFTERFAREARALAKLSHPNIVAVHDFGQAGGFHFLLMEFVDGTSLRQAMQAGRMAPSEALAIVPPLCDALQYAHDRGIVHRDIKPENILLTREGVVKVADFGLAKLVGATGVEVDIGLTGVGDVMGTPHYMAPEQVEHPQAVDHRADIYSLGVVFYQMLTGELPLGRFAPPSSRLRGIRVDVRLDEIVLRALEKEPERRYQQASEVKTEVETVGRRRDVQPPTDDAATHAVAELVRLPANLLLIFAGLSTVIHAAVGVAALFGWRMEGLFAPSTARLVVGMISSGFVAWSAWRMGRISGWGIALAGAVVAIVSAPLANIAGVVAFLVGFWSIGVLSYGRVRQLFEMHPAGLPVARGGSSARRRAIIGAVVIALVAGGLLLFALLEKPGSAARLDRPAPRNTAVVAGGPAAGRRAYHEHLETLIARHDPVGLDIELGAKRDELKLLEARFAAGVADRQSVRQARAEVEFIEAEIAGADDRALIGIRLRLAREIVAELEARHAAGLVDNDTVADARDTARFLDAVLGDDPVAPLAILVDGHARRLASLEARYQAGLAGESEVREARMRFELARLHLDRAREESPAGQKKTETP